MSGFRPTLVGTLYRAEQTRPVRRPVALKLFKVGSTRGRSARKGTHGRADARRWNAK
jgi:hypothetical protein